MNTDRTLPAILAACTLLVSGVAFAENESATASDATRHAPMLTQRERDWIEDKCKMEHPMNMEKRQHCMEEKEHAKEHEKAEHEHKK